MLWYIFSLFKLYSLLDCSHFRRTINGSGQSTSTNCHWTKWYCLPGPANSSTGNSNQNSSFIKLLWKLPCTFLDIFSLIYILHKMKVNMFLLRYLCSLFPKIINVKIFKFNLIQYNWNRYGWKFLLSRLAITNNVFFLII